MPTLSIDIETRCALKLGDVGVYKYAEHDSFRVLLFSYAVDDQPVQLCDLTHTALPDDVRAMLTDPAVTKTAWNAQFERVCLSRLLGTVLPPEQWECTMVLAACSGLPRSLAEAGRALGLSDEEAKIKDGERLIRRFSCPVKWGEEPARFRDPDEFPEDWRRYCEYNIRDVEVERTIRKRLLKYAPGPAERRAYALDQRINDLGVLCDRHLAEQAVRISNENAEALKAEAATLTRLDNPNSVTQLKGWLGLSVGDSLDKKAVAQLRRVNSNAVVDRVLAIRQDLGKTSVKKYEAMLTAACNDNRLRGMFKFCGASRTGRWSGSLVQLQNLAQNHIPDLELARELVDSGSREDVSLFFGSVPQVLSELVRTALVAREGHTLVVADFSSIEARVIAWLACETWRMRVFESGGDIYCASASQMFHVPVEKGGLNGHLRQKGKIAELALGYGGGTGAMRSMGALDMGLHEDELQPIVTAWREASPNIVALWRDIGQAAVECVQTGEIRRAARGRIAFMRDENVLEVRLPSGRKIRYWQPQVTLDRFGNETLAYAGTEAGKWGRVDTFGGKLTENVVQSIARDCLRDAMLAVWQLYPTIQMHIHDEMVLEAPKGEANAALARVLEIMARPVPWAPGLKLGGAGYITDFYRKD